MSNIDITLKTSDYVHYYEYMRGISPIKRLYVRSDELVEGVDISITSSPSFLVDYELHDVTLPRRSNVSFDIDATLSPLFLTNIDESVEGEIIVTCEKDGIELARVSSPIDVLGFDTLRYGNEPALIASYVQHSELVSEVADKTRGLLHSWKKNTNIGYAKSTKNDVRYTLAAIYKVLMDYSFTRVDSTRENGDIIMTPHEAIAKSHEVDTLSLALIIASVLEDFHFNSVIAHSGDEWLVGAWLREECFPELTIDESELLTKRMAVGVNDFTAISSSDLLTRISFEGSEKRCRQLIAKHFDFAIDVRRARIGGVAPLPLRVKKAHGYDLVDTTIYDTDVVPHDIEEYNGDVAIDSGMTKEKQWERRLLDLSMRNALLNFKDNKNSMKLIFGGIGDFVTRFDENREYSILPLPRDIDSIPPFGEKLSLTPAIDLLNIEMKAGKLHANMAGEDYDKTMINVYRKDKVFLEESGTNSLYIAVGFLRYKGDMDREPKYSPLFLYPVRLTKKAGSKDSYTVRLTEDEVRINSTLLEYLFQEFGIDIRGLMNTSLDSDTILSIVGRIRREIVDRSGWDITEDIFLTNVSFSSYLMWTDIKNRIEDFRSNKLIRGFIDNSTRVFDSADYELTDAHSDDTYNEDGIYLPLSADSSQYSAIKDSLDKSFVLHGPPGTGKSQTITNIIANNILRGKRVLFVAEKLAALSVVEKRLCDIGLGDFCLELHSNKNNKTDVVHKLSNTMSLADAALAKDYLERAEEIRSLIADIDESMIALHKVRRLGVSVYEGAMRYLENKDAQSTLKIEPIFYERLTKDTLKTYEDMLTELVSVGRDCGEISSSPFKYVGNIMLDDTFRARAEETIDILTMEIHHIMDYAGMLMDVMRIRTSVVTNERLRAMHNICMLVYSNSAVKAYMANSPKYDNAYGIIEAYMANMAKQKELLDACLAIYEYIPDNLPCEELVTATDRRLLRAEKKTRKMMSKLVISTSPTAEDDGIELLKRLYTVERDIESILEDVEKILDCDQNIDESVKSVNSLFDSARVLYADFNKDSFESVIRNMSTRYIVRQFVGHYELYNRAYKTFKKTFDITSIEDNVDIHDLKSYSRHLKDNLDLMPNWCRYNALLDNCKRMGLQFVVTPLRSGDIVLENVLKCFRKSVYGNFVESELALDKTLSGFSGKSVEEKIEKLRMLSDNYEQLTCQEMYYRMVSRIPRRDEEGAHNIEMVMLGRAEKSGMKGVTLRKLFLDIPTVMKYACPCMLMSPVSVAQYLDMDLPKFDLVVFDEASQMPTAEAIGSIARANNVIVVGDPKQLPPTKFFNSEYKDEENQGLEDLESILDDCLALGMPERHLLWHYRSQDESLIAFSNAMYYDNKLLTFPSPMELDSKVKMAYVDGVYERGGSKRNKKEAEALVDEVIRRLRDGKHMSIGIVTFNTAQQNYIDDLLRDAIKKNNLFSEAYECDEPIFVKNLENVQGDERDIILFSVGYGPDASGKLSLNFGPINQSGGYRRLNVAITRARAEMIVFTSITGNMIDLGKTDNKGVKGLKAFLEYAERGRDMLIFDSKSACKTRRKGIGAYIAEELRERGFECEYDVGVSDFKIDCAVVDPRDKSRYVLAIMCDGDNANNIGSVRDRMTMNGKILKRLGWNVYYLWTINYLNNSKREIQKIRDYLMTFTKAKAPSKKAIRETISRYKHTYKGYTTRPLARGSADYILDEANRETITDKVRDVISVEGPISEDILLSRLTAIYNITRASKKACQELVCIASSIAIREEYMDKVFYRFERDDELSAFRPIDEKKGKREVDDIHPFEIISAMRCILESRVKLCRDELVRETLELIGYTRKTKRAPLWLNMAIDMAINLGTLILTPNDMITM